MRCRMGNPVQSDVVRAYKQGYTQHVRIQGYATTSATHLSVISSMTSACYVELQLQNDDQ